MTAADIPERCKQCGWRRICLLGVKMGHYGWARRIPVCEEKGWFKWESKLTKYDFEEIKSQAGELTAADFYPDKVEEILKRVRIESSAVSPNN